MSITKVIVISHTGSNWILLHNACNQIDKASKLVLILCLYLGFCTYTNILQEIFKETFSFFAVLRWYF